MVVRRDGDWVFERMLPDRMESELVLFQFRELDRVAAADVLLRRGAKSVQVVWSLNEEKQRTAQFRIEPCCTQQDDAVFAALKQAVERLFEEEKKEALRFARAFLVRARDSG